VDGGGTARILIADDDQSIRLLLRRILEFHEDWRVCGDAADGRDAVEKVLALEPDVALLDLAMPGMNGFQAARAIKEQSPFTALLLVSVQEVTGALVQAAREAGFAGAVTKASGQEVIRALESLLRHETYFVLEESNSRVG
jgi:DNA-binding NarL/FixJ family response regulator